MNRNTEPSTSNFINLVGVLVDYAKASVNAIARFARSEVAKAKNHTK